MSKILAALGRKIFGLALIFNSLISLTSATNILTSFYLNKGMWCPYSPYLLDGSLFWFVVSVAVLNIFSAKIVGKAHIKRVLFHHYFYGFLVILIALLSIALIAPAYILFLLTPSAGFTADGFQNFSIYTVLFLVYGGLTLVIDDVYDVSLRAGRLFDRMKMKMRKLDKTFQTIHLCSCLMSIYVAASVFLWYLENCSSMVDLPLLNISYMILIPSLFVTCIWGLRGFKGEMWSKILSQPQTKKEFQQ